MIPWSVVILPARAFVPDAVCCSSNFIYPNFGAKIVIIGQFFRERNKAGKKNRIVPLLRFTLCIFGKFQLMIMIELFGLSFTLAEFAGLCLFVLAFLVQLFYLFVLGRFIFGNRKKKQEEKFPSVSIIVSSRNFSEQWKEMLPVLLSQEYPDFEVVVVNDCSSDNTEWTLRELSMQYANLKSTQIHQETDFPNALAITVGIRAATKEWVLFLNPLCRISGDNWLKQYASRLKPKHEAAVGYINYTKAEGNSKRTFRYETFYSFLMSGAARLLGMPMPLNENNMAYRREMFLGMKGFAAVLNSPFSENELFLNKISRKKNTVIHFDKITPANYVGEAEWIDAVNFKKKQLLIKQRFSFGQRFFLFLNVFSRLLLDWSMVFVAIVSPWRFWILGVWALVLVLEIIWLAVATKRLGEKNMLPGLLLYNFVIPFINGYYVVNQLFTGQRRKWK